MADNKQVDIPLSVMADALDCFWNPAVNAIRDASFHGPASGADVVGAIANGLAAVAAHLREYANEKRVDAPAAVPVDVNPLAAYAESYRIMARIGDGKVDCLSVAADIENNMFRYATHSQPAATKETF